MKMPDAVPADLRCVDDAHAHLGESPMWSQAERALYWIDIGGDGHRAALHRHDPYGNASRSWPLPESVGALALCDGGAILALQSGLHRLDFASGDLRLLAPAAHDRERLRYNDGRCDRQGRFWIGQAQTRVGDGPNGQGALWRYDGHTLQAIVPDIGVANGIAFSADGRTMYYADVLRSTVFACDYDIETGLPGAAREFVRFAPGVVPDGATVDADGGYWIALYRAGKLARHGPDGRLDREIALPVSCPTMVAFGGDELDLLFVTSASHRLTAAERAAQPQAGGLFCCRPGVRGLPETRFRASARAEPL